MRGFWENAGTDERTDEHTMVNPKVSRRETSRDQKKANIIFEFSILKLVYMPIFSQIRQMGQSDPPRVSLTPIGGQNIF